MTLKIQNYRSTTSGDKPPSLLEGQVAFNLADNFMYLGKGLNQNLDVDGDPVLPDPPTGEGWQEYNMDVGAPGNVSSVSVSGEGLSVNQTTGAVVITSTLIKQVAGASSMSIGPSTPSPGSSSGGNTFVGAFAGEDHGGTNGLSTYVGSNSGKNVVGGNQNVFVGALTVGHPVTSASGCTFIGYNPGASLSASTSLMTIVGGHQGYAGTSGEVIIGRNSCFLRLNTNGALCIADNVATQDFGVSGQYLTSNGSDGPPTWGYPTLATPEEQGAVYAVTPSDAEGTTNVFFGTHAGVDVTTGDNNLLLGFSAGDGLTTESNNIVVGNSNTEATGSSGMIAIGNDGQTAQIAVNSSGALAVSGSGYGEALQVLTSGGSGAAPTWGNPATFADTGAVASGGFTSILISSLASGQTNLQKIAVMANQGDDKYYSWVIDLAYSYDGTTTTGFNNIATVMDQGSGANTLTPSVVITGSQYAVRLTSSSGIWNYKLTALVY